MHDGNHEDIGFRGPLDGAIHSLSLRFCVLLFNATYLSTARARSQRAHAFDHSEVPGMLRPSPTPSAPFSIDFYLG